MMNSDDSTNNPSLTLVGDEDSGYFPRLQTENTDFGPYTLFEIVPNDPQPGDSDSARQTFTIDASALDSGEATAQMYWGDTLLSDLSHGMTLDPYNMAKDCAYKLVVTMADGATGMESGFDPGWVRNPKQGKPERGPVTFTLDPYVRLRRKDYSLTVAPPS